MDNTYLCHFGRKNQEWGKRQYQYEDGSLTPLGRIHYGVGAPRDDHDYHKMSDRDLDREIDRQRRSLELDKIQNDREYEQARHEFEMSRLGPMNYQELPAPQKEDGKKWSKKLLIGGAAIGGIAVGAYLAKNTKTISIAKQMLKSESTKNSAKQLVKNATMSTIKTKHEAELEKKAEEKEKRAAKRTEKKANTNTTKDTVDPKEEYLKVASGASDSLMKDYGPNGVSDFLKFNYSAGYNYVNKRRR